MHVHHEKATTGSPLLRHCQWIAGEPSANDDCKCGRPVIGRPRYPYCPKHLVRAALPPDDPEKLREMRNCAIYLQTRETPYKLLDWSWLW